MRKDKKTPTCITDNLWSNELGPNCEIGKKLRAYYSSIQEEALPGKFLDLLEQLDEAEEKAKIKLPESEAGGEE